MLFLLLLGQISLCLLARDVNEIAHRQVSINQMQSPVGLHLSCDDYIAHDVVGAWVFRIAMYRDGKISAFLVGDAFGGEQTGHAA